MLNDFRCSFSLDKKYFIGYLFFWMIVWQQQYLI